MRFPGNGADVPDRIAGVTYLSNSTSRSFFKVYTLTRSGSIWNVEPAPPKYLNGRTISMDNNSLIADINQVPRAVKVNGNDCIYFAYLNPPVGSSGGEGSNSRVSLCLYDINNKKFTTLDYDGPVKTKDGRQYIYGKPLQTVNSPELRFLQQEAASPSINLRRSCSRSGVRCSRMISWISHMASTYFRPRRRKHSAVLRTPAPSGRTTTGRASRRSRAARRCG